MSEKEFTDQEEIHSKVLRAGRRTYFFDVRSTKAGDYYLTVTESKKFTHEDGSFHYKKHKIYLYKEDFESFREILGEMMDFIIDEKGSEVISEKHQKDFKTTGFSPNGSLDTSGKSFTDLDFDDI
ncbi:MAG: PUR family DNA/RNA-binding protein, partial [Robiginitalea sp.]